MTEIKAIAVSESLDFYNRTLVKAKAIVDGVEVDKSIYLTKLSDDTLRKYVNFDEERGLITRVSLLDAQGREWYAKEFNYKKGAQGYMVVFPFTQRIKGVNK